MGLLTKAVTTIARGLGLSSPMLYEFYGGERTHSGKRVNIDSAMQLDTVWACVRLISQTISTLPLPVYRRRADNQGEPAPDHPLYPIIHDRPNAEMTAVEFWKSMTGCLELWGNAYARVVRGANNRVVALLPMMPNFMQVRRDFNGVKTFVYSNQNVIQYLGEEDVLHLKGFSLDGVMGISPVAAGRMILGSAIAAEEASGKIFANGMRPSGVLKADKYLNDKQREDARGIISRFSGAQNSGRVPLLEGGWTFEKLEIPPEDAQLLQTRSFHVEQICRWFDVPPIMIGHMEKSTAWGTGLEQMNLWFLTYALRARLKGIEQAISRVCLSPEDRDQYYAEFNVEGLLRGDSQGRAQLYKTLFTNALRTANELRALDNLPPMEGGDELVIQSNMIPIRRLGEITSVPRERLVKPGAAVAPPTNQPRQQG